MNKPMLTGIWRFMIKVPPAPWEKQIEKHRRRILSDLETTIRGGGDLRPILFVPDVNVQNLEEPSIIESFGKQSVFFRS